MPRESHGISKTCLRQKKQNILRRQIFAQIFRFRRGTPRNRPAENGRFSGACAASAKRARLSERNRCESRPYSPDPWDRRVARQDRCARRGRQGDAARVADGDRSGVPFSASCPVVVAAARHARPRVVVHAVTRAVLLYAVASALAAAVRRPPAARGLVPRRRRRPRRGERFRPRRPMEASAGGARGRGRDAVRPGPERGHAGAQDEFRRARLPARHTRRGARREQGVQEEPSDKLQQKVPRLRGAKRAVPHDVAHAQPHRFVARRFRSCPDHRGRRRYLGRDYLLGETNNRPSMGDNRCI